MEILDIFNSDPFKVTNLVGAINKQPFKPGRLGDMGIFMEEGITTTSIAIEEKQGVLALVSNSPRGSNPQPAVAEKRKMRSFLVPHLEVTDALLADAIQGVRAFGMTELESIERVRDARLQRMANRLDVTLEWHRLGALKGVILDADASTVIYNLFTEFGVSQTTHDWLLGTATDHVMSAALQTKRDVEDTLGADVYNHIHVLCGKTFFTELITHAEVKDTYRYQQGQFNRTDNRKGFEYAGMVFEEYRGKVAGQAFIADAEAYAFPVGVPGLFMTYFAPADYMETVNTLGLPRYTKAQLMDFQKGIELEAQSNPLNICTRPDVVIKLTTSN